MGRDMKPHRSADLAHRRSALTIRQRGPLAAGNRCACATSVLVGKLQLWLYSTAVAVAIPALDLRPLGRVGLALADPTRRRILVALLDGPAYPGEMADAFDTTRANLSNHLTCLRECGLVVATAEGRRVRYDLADPRLGDALGILASLDLPGCCDD
jgi:DNA-binding transcriptional ArsR family regulator